MIQTHVFLYGGILRNHIRSLFHRYPFIKNDFRDKIYLTSIIFSNMKYHVHVISDLVCFSLYSFLHAIIPLFGLIFAFDGVADTWSNHYGLWIAGIWCSIMGFVQIILFLCLIYSTTTLSHRKHIGILYYGMMGLFLSGWILDLFPFFSYVGSYPFMLHSISGEDPGSYRVYIRQIMFGWIMFMFSLPVFLLWFILCGLGWSQCSSGCNIWFERFLHPDRFFDRTDIEREVGTMTGGTHSSPHPLSSLRRHLPPLRIIIDHPSVPPPPPPTPESSIPPPPPPPTPESPICPSTPPSSPCVSTPPSVCLSTPLSPYLLSFSTTLHDDIHIEIDSPYSQLQSPCSYHPRTSSGFWSYHAQPISTRRYSM